MRKLLFILVVVAMTSCDIPKNHQPVLTDVALYAPYSISGSTVVKIVHDTIYSMHGIPMQHRLRTIYGFQKNVKFMGTDSVLLDTAFISSIRFVDIELRARD